MSDRPHIPKDVEREILIESGHRCAVCGDACPIQRAHIIPWHKTHEHKACDLICICANCHARADGEEWDEKTLRDYKERPWVLKRFDGAPPPKGPAAVVDLTFAKITVAQFGDCQRQMLSSALAAMMGLPPNAVKIIEIKQGSVTVRIRIPSRDAQSLIRAAEDHDPLLTELLQPLELQQATLVSNEYVGTIVGESTSSAFRLAVAHDAVREQDIIAVDAEPRGADRQRNAASARVWAKVQKIERMNPLFPSEAGHELAETRTDPFDTVLSLSREMVTAECQVLGVEPHDRQTGRLEHLRYPPKPASTAYLPAPEHLERILLGDLREHENRGLDIATLSNRPGVSLRVDGHAIVSRHLAILAMTGAGKSVTARRVIEELARKNYPIVIFDPHGDYTGLQEVPSLAGKVRRYYALFPVFEEDSETVARIVDTLGYELSPTMSTLFPEVFDAARAFYIESNDERKPREYWLSQHNGRPDIGKYGTQRNMWLVANMAEAAEIAIRKDDADAKRQLTEWGWERVEKYSKTDLRTLEGIKKRTFKAAGALQRMERTNQKVARSADPLPLDRKALVQYGQISVVSLAGYTGDFQSTLFTLVADSLFEARVSEDLKLPVLLVLEEAHNFAPAQARTIAEERAVTATRQIAQEGRKFGVGMIVISQRPSRLDETTLSQCNSFIVMRMVNPADQNFVKRVIETIGEDEARLLPDLDVGEAILSGQMVNFPMLARIKKPESEGEHEEIDAFEALEQARLATHSA